MTKVASSPEVVRAYVREYDLEDAVLKTIELVQNEFPRGSTISFSVEGDGESDELWLVAHVTINAPRASVFDLYNRFVDVWIETMPKPARHRIHLTYSAR